MGLLRRRADSTRVTAEGVTIPSGARDVREVYPEPLTTRQRWLLGLGALMLDPRHGSCARLHPAAVVHPQRTAREYRASLKSLWEIDDLSSLLRALASLLRVGHRGELIAAPSATRRWPGTSPGSRCCHGAPSPPATSTSRRRGS